MSDPLYEKLVKRWEEVTELPPQTVGPLTPLYKRVIKYVKVMPWPVVAGISLIFVSAVFILVGSGISRIVSLLQRGF